MPSLIGNKPNQVPTVGDLGTMAFREQDQFYSSQQTMGFKNRIINGAMMIDQRNAGASVTPSDGSYLLDRWKYEASQASKFTAQQSSIAPAGFVNSMLFTSSSAYSVGSSDYFLFEQFIEGLNVADLGWGTANAQPITLGFWVRSSLTGTFGGGLANSAYNRTYIFSYTINAANTWEYKTVTIAGDTSGTWLTTNGKGITVRFSLGTGSTYSTTAGSWGTTIAWNPTGAVNVVATSGATFYITGVQLEKGSTATSFDYRPYGTELALCQRYYQKSYNIDVVPATATTVGVISWLTQFTFDFHRPDTIQLKTAMRASPTITLYNPSTGATASMRNSTDSTNVAGATFREGMGSFAAYINGSSIASGKELQFHYVAAIDL